MTHFLIFGALLGFARANSPSTITIGLVLDDVSTINATDLTTALQQVNADNTVLSNSTIAVETITLQSGQYVQKQLCDAASRGVSTAISVTRCRNLPSVKSSFNTFNLPVINIGPEPCPLEDDSLFLNVEGHLSNVATFARDIVKSLNWKRTHIFYDSSFSFAVLVELQTLLDAEQVYTTLINLSTVTDLEATMKEVYNIRQTEYWRYMIAATTTNTLWVLEQAKTSGLRDKDKMWVILNPEVPYTTVEPHLDVLDNIGIIRKLIRKESWLCEPQQTALSKLVNTIFGAYEDLVESGTWTDQTVANCSGTWSIGDELMSFTKGRAASLIESCKNFTQYELRTSRMIGNTMRFKRGAKWNKRDGIHVDGLMFPNTNTGFNGKTFLVSTLPFSFFQRKTIDENGTAHYTGLAIDIMNILANNLNFTIKYVEPVDRYWGAPDENGNWNGIIRQLVDKEVDIAAASHTITAARSSVVDFAEAYYFEPSIIMLKNPGAGSRLTVYIEPLHKWVWLCTFASMPSVALILWLVTKYSPFYTNQDPSCYPECTPLFKLRRCMWYVYGSMWQQGQSEMPKAMSGRFVLLVWWTFVVVILATYSGNLIAFLTVTKVTLPISSLGDLPEQDDLAYGTVFGSALWSLLEASNAGAPQRVWNGMDMNSQPDTYGAGKDMVLNGDFAFICERSYYEDSAANNCELTKVPKEEFFFNSYGIGIPKGSPLKDMFSAQIRAMSESGLLNKLSTDWVPRQKCAGLTYTESKPAKLEDTQGAFIVLGFGLGFGLIAMIAELVHFYCIKDKTKGKKLGPIVFGSGASVKSNVVVPFSAD